MARQRDGGGATVVEEELVDLSPEAMEVKRNLENAGLCSIDIGRVQAIVERWREKVQHIPNFLDNRGEPVPIGQMPVTESWTALVAKQIDTIIEDCCHKTVGFMRQKAYRERQLNANGVIPVEKLATALAPPAGELRIVPIPQR